MRVEAADSVLRSHARPPIRAMTRTPVCYFRHRRSGAGDRRFGGVPMWGGGLLDHRENLRGSS